MPSPMSSVQILTMGSNANLMFYAWRLHETKACSVSVVNPAINSHNLQWVSTSLGTSLFQPSALVSSLSQLGDAKFDMVILNVSSLQEFQNSCNALLPFINDDSVVVVESTGYINLEPFVQLSLPKLKNLSICSIMNESDVKQTGSNLFYHSMRGHDNRIYLGTASSSSTGSASSFQRLYKLLQLVQEDSLGSISLLKSTSPKEFMTYQWKLALPRIVFNPLSIIFEEEYPANLTNQILCKPLISGIINEIFKIIKKMDCKLVKGTENEANLLKHWSNIYPVLKNGDNPDYINSNTLFYNFFHRYDAEIDLLLLQPILLADDNGVRTPYLENLYSMLCQLLKVNQKDSSSIFFARKISDNGEMLSKQQQLEKLHQDYESKLEELNILSHDLSKQNIDKNQVENQIQEKLVLKNQLDYDLNQQQENLKALNLSIESQTEKFRLLQNEHESKMKELQSKQVQETSREVSAASKTQSPQKPVRDSVMGAGLEDFTDIALYGAQLNGEAVQPDPNVAQLQERELELQRREQALLNKELQYQDPNHASMHGPNSQIPSQGQTSSMNSSMHLPNGAMAPNMNMQHPNMQHPNMHYQNMPGQYGPNQPNGNYRQTSQGSDGYSTYSSGYYDMNQNQMNQGMNQNQNQMNQMNQYGPMNGPMNGHMNGMNGQMNQMNQMQMNQMNGQMSQMNLNGPPMNQMNGKNFEQQPPHGLPSNGMPSNALPANLKKSGQYGNQMPMAPQNFRPQRVGSNPSIHPEQHQQFPQQQQQQQQQYPQQYPQQFSKKPNRRSGFPQMDDSSLRLDYGGRGGMPLSSMQGTKVAKHRLTIPLGASSMASNPQRKSMNGASMLNAAAYQENHSQNSQNGQNQNHNQNYQNGQNGQNPNGQGQNHGQNGQNGQNQYAQNGHNGQNQHHQAFLQPPHGLMSHTSGLNASTNSSNSAAETPKTTSPEIPLEGIRIDVPVAENAKPLGGVAEPKTDKKKKKKLFGKK